MEVIPPLASTAGRYKCRRKGRTAAETTRNASAYSAIQQYLVAYFGGKYVDRSGTLLLEAKVENNKVGTTPLWLPHKLYWTAIRELYTSPVFYQKDNKWKTTWSMPEQRTHRRALTKDDQGKYDTNATLNISLTGSPITEDEAHAMVFSQVSRQTQSKLISGFVVRNIQQRSLHYVIAAICSRDKRHTNKGRRHLFENSSGAATEALAYSYFKSHDASS